MKKRSALSRSSSHKKANSFRKIQQRPLLSLWSGRLLTSVIKDRDTPAGPVDSVEGVQGASRRTLDENIQKLKEDFNGGLFFRTFSDPKDEYEKTVKSKIAIENDEGKIDKRYWASTSSLQEDAHLPVWNPDNERTGFFLSSDVEIGGWNMQDMGTDNPLETWPDQQIKDHFPNNFPRVAFSPILKKIEENDHNLVRQILGLESHRRVTDLEKDSAQDFLLTTMTPGAPGHDILMKRIPEYCSVYDMESIRGKMRDASKHQKENEVISSYNEAKIHYKPNDIIGIYFSSNEVSQKKAQELQANLAKDGLMVPLVSYDTTTGKIEIYETLNDFLYPSSESNFPHGT